MVPDVPQTEEDFKLHEALLEQPAARGGALMNEKRGGISRVLVQEDRLTGVPGPLVDASRPIVTRNTILNNRHYGRKNHKVSIEDSYKRMGEVTPPSAVKIATIPVPQPVGESMSGSITPVGRASPAAVPSPFGPVAAPAARSYIIYWDIPGMESTPFFCDDVTVDEHVVVVSGLSSKLPIPVNGVADMAVCDDKGVVFTSSVKNGGNHTQVNGVEVLILRIVRDEAATPPAPSVPVPPSPFPAKTSNAEAIPDAPGIPLETEPKAAVDELMDLLDNLG